MAPNEDIVTTAYRAGLRRGLDACASPRGVFTVLALDHRQNLRREIRPDDPDSVSIDEMADLKRDVVRGLAGHVSGVLLDPEFGAPRCIADGSLPGSVGLIVAIEATGYEGRRPRAAAASSMAGAWPRRSGWPRPPPSSSCTTTPTRRLQADQERLVRDVANECRRLDLALFLEPITYPVDPSQPSLIGEDRRRAVIETARRLTAIGGDVLKVEFPYDASVTDEGRWAEACARRRHASPLVLLSGGVDGDIRAPGRGRLPGRCERRARGPIGLGGGEPTIGGGPATVPRDRGRRAASAARLHHRSSRPTVAPSLP